MSLAHPINILLVDDNPGNLLAMEAQLSNPGYNLVQAHSGSEALRRLLREEFAVVLLDVQMPEMDGFETARLIRQHPRSQSTPIIFITAISRSPEYIFKGYSSGAVDYLCKPVETAILQSKVAVFVELYQKSNETRRQFVQLVAINKRLEQEIARREQVEQALKERAAELESANRAQDRFMANMSHELRTPLNAIIGFTELIYDHRLGPISVEQQEYLRDVLVSSQHLLALINELLDLAKIKSGRAVITPEPLLVGEILQESIGIVRPLLEQRQIRVTIGARSSCDQHILADRQRVRQVVLNLLSNAIKYNREQGSITLSCAPASSDRLRISVRDSGMGIAPDQLKRLFRPFERLGVERSRVEGTGLGLVHAKHLVETMGGVIGVESQVGQGTTFWVEFSRIEPS